MNTTFFNPIRLEEMEKVKLMNRNDAKYWFYSLRLQDILDDVKDDYFILRINGESDLLYSTTYYDTIRDRMFIEHHNGKLNRYKVRRRSYVSSGISFLEVKFKNNKGRTIKKRMLTEYGNTSFTSAEEEFLNRHIPFKTSDLYPSLINGFSRITLVNKNFKERCTIDSNLQFKTGNNVVPLDNLAIIEIKSEGKSSNSPLAMTLREQRIKNSGFSKYCIGRTLTDLDLKRNAFKDKIRRIEKTTHPIMNIN